MATKKISELPLVNRVSGSQVAGGSVLPIVIGGGIQGTTNQISVEDFSIFVNAYNAHTGSAGNTFTGPQTINNNVTINGKLTVTELVATYETASIIYSEGGNIFGNELIDKQQFTGSSNFTGSVFINGQNYTAYSSSNSTVFTNFSSSNSTYNTTFSSSNAAYVTALSSSNSSYNTIFSSSNSTTITTFLAGTNSELARVYQTTASIQAQTASLLQFTASQDGRNFIISQYTSSTDAHIVGISAFTSSQLAVNLGNSIYTASVDSHIVGISTYTSSVRDTLARVHQATESIQFQTASLLTFTASQDSRNFTLSQVTGSFRGEIGGLEAYSASLKAAAIVSSSTQVQNYDIFGLNSNLYRATGSLIGITNGLMAFTAALDNTYATDAQLYQLYQATRSIELHSGSMVGITNGLMAYTSSNETWKTGIRGEISGIEAWTASLDNTFATDAQLYPILQATRSLELLSGSVIGITNGLMAYTSSNETWKTGIRGEISAIEAWTASLDSTYATDAQLYQLYAETASIKAEIAGIEALTASFKAAAIVSSSTQIQNYNLFAVTSSVNTFWANQNISGSLGVRDGITGSLLGNVNGNATTATTANLATNAGNIAVVRDNTDTTLYPVFTGTVAADTYYSLKGHASGTLYYNGLTQQLIVSGGGLVVTGSANITGSSTIIGKETITGSLLVTGSITITGGSITMPHRPAFRIVGTGGEVLAPYVLSGSKVSVDYNQGNHFNTTNGLFTAPIAGLYQVNVVIRTNSNTNSTINQLIVYKSGSLTSGNVSQIMIEFGPNTSMNHAGGSTISYLDTGDTLKAVVAVGTCSFDGNDNFSVAYIG